MATSAQSPSRIRFDGFEVDLDSGDVWKAGARVRLQEQPFQVLRLLLERRGEIVTREELRQKLWPKTIVDFDDGLSTAVRKIRELLGDSADQPRYIETIPKRGYRFIAAVDGGLAKTRRFRASWIATAVLAIAVIAVTWTRWTEQAVSVRSIAVLPLQNLSGDPAQDYFAAGITDAITTELARAVGGRLRVTSRASAEKYRGRPLAEIAGELDVDCLIQGSVTRSRDRVRITAQLVDARSDRHLWAATYDRDLHDVLAVQGEIAATVARRVQIKLDPRAEARLAVAGTVNPQAYDLYQRGRYSAFSNNRREIEGAIAQLEEAVRLDPNFAPPHALLARAYATQTFLSDPEQRDLEAKALATVNRALQLDPDLADAYLARGLVPWTHHNGFPHEQAIREIQRALDLDPNLAEAHHWLGTIYNHVGLLEAGRAQLATALRLDPANAGIRYRIASSALLAGNAREALAGLEATRAFFPANAAYYISSALFELDRKQEAAATIGEYLDAHPRDEGGVGHAMRALIRADAGDTAGAERDIAHAIRTGTGFGHFHHAAYTIGATYAVMNRPRDAVRWLREAVDDGFPCYPLFERDRALDKLRGDADFAELLKDLKRRLERFRTLASSTPAPPSRW